MQSMMENNSAIPSDMETETEYESENSTADKKPVKLSKNRRRRMKKKQRKQQKVEKMEETRPSEEIQQPPEDVEIEYVTDSIDLDPSDPLYYEFNKIVQKFAGQSIEAPTQSIQEILPKKPKDIDEIEDDDDENDVKKIEKPKTTGRKERLANRMTVAELKQFTDKPEVVELHDVNARDPKLLVMLKATRNTVPVPRHWCDKRRYLNGKRGFEKPPFKLPEFIARTGITAMRDALHEKEENMTVKSKMKAKVRPKLGKIDIDYQKLHDAFFKYQTKPKLTGHGDIYYEGKEFQLRNLEYKPGKMSDELRTALGMPIGPGAEKVPPPWLVKQQQYGPPPSYPNFRIPGLNAPVPAGCSFGYFAGGWGKPPVDAVGIPIYGDVFGTGEIVDEPLPDVCRTLWGEFEPESESEEEEDDDDDVEDAKEEDEASADGFETPMVEGLETPSGAETPKDIELRKSKIEREMETNEAPSLFTVLPVKQVQGFGGAMMASSHVYDIASTHVNDIASVVGGKKNGVDVTLDPSELEMDAVALASKYEAKIRERMDGFGHQDLSDMVAEHSANQNKKRKKPVQNDDGNKKKKYKEFKF